MGVASKSTVNNPMIKYSARHLLCRKVTRSPSFSLSSLLSLPLFHPPSLLLFPPTRTHERARARAHIWHVRSFMEYKEQKPTQIGAENPPHHHHHYHRPKKCASLTAIITRTRNTTPIPQPPSLHTHARARARTRTHTYKIIALTLRGIWNVSRYGLNNLSATRRGRRTISF